MSKSIVGIGTRGQAEKLVNRLQNEVGIAASEISILLPDTEGTHDFGHIKATKAPEAATTGVVAGGLTGGVLGLLAGIGALAIPGAGPFIAAGPIMAALGGGALGATAGGLVGALIGLGVPEYEAKTYAEKLQRGNYLVAARTLDGDDLDKVKAAFKAEGLEDIATTSDASAPKA